MSEESQTQKLAQMNKKKKEKAILMQIATFLVEEGFIEREEQLQYVACLREDE